MTDVTLLRLNAVKERTGLSRSAIYRFMDQGRFPRPTPQSRGPACYWRSDEVEKAITQLAAKRRHGDYE